MGRMVVMAGLAIALLGGGSMAAISRTTNPPPARAHRGATRAAAPLPAEAPPGEVAGGPTGPAVQPPVLAARMPAPGSPVTATGPSSETALAPAAHMPSRTVRRLFRAKQLREQLPARRGGGPGRIGGLLVPPEEGVAMGAHGIDWGRPEPTTEGGATPDGGAADEEGR